MITSAEEFVNLRSSNDPQQQEQASRDSAGIDVWIDVINRFPDLKFWVVHNKTIQIELLEILVDDDDPNVRSAVARKRKINDVIFDKLAADPDEEVRYALLCNTKITKEQIKKIKADDSEWLKAKLIERFAELAK